jgi:hypothetical protein
MLSQLRIEVAGFNKDGERVIHESYSAQAWFTEPQPLVDSASERVRLGVTRVEGVQSTATGQVILRWKSIYGDNGVELEGWEWDKHGREQYTQLGQRERAEL